MMREDLILEDLPLLFVDDEPDVLRALRRTVERAGWPARFEPHARAGLAAMDEQAFSVVVSDFRMPDMDGVRFLAEVRERSPNTERVLLTAYADADALERGINDAAIGTFLRKPWKRDVLLNILEQAMRQNRLRREHAVLQERIRNRNEELSYLNQLLKDSVEESARTLMRFRRRWDVALGAISDPIAIVDRYLRLEGANDAAAALAGTSFDEIEGRPCHEALFKRGSPCVGCPIENGRGEIVDEHEGTPRVFDARAYPLPGSDDSVLCVYRDVTREREFQVRSAHMEKMAAIGRLAGGVAHEINNPLHGILSFVQLAQKPNVPPEKLARYHEVIKECALRCRDIVSALRDYSRRSTSERSPVDLNVVCQKAMVLFERVAECEVTFHPSDAAAMVEGNANQLQQVVINLIQNAVDASPPKGKVTVWVEASGDCMVGVDDQGSGVPVEERERIFEPFYTTKPEGKGTGLGLAISHTIMREHGGRLVVGDAPRGGARFELRLPPMGHRAEVDARGGVHEVTDSGAPPSEPSQEHLVEKESNHGG